MDSSHLYGVYGLRLKSDWPLLSLLPAEYPGIEICLKKGSESHFQAGRSSYENVVTRRLYRYTRLGDGFSYLCWPDLFEFLIRSDGLEILGNPLPKATKEVFSTYLLGQVLSFALLKQGIEQLHCTAIVVDGAAICFLGDCGYGKSTLGASFVQAGYQLLTDDLLVIKPWNEGYLAYPGPARIKLFPKDAARFFEKSEGLPMNHFTSKLVIPLRQPSTYRNPIPLGAIYVLNHPNRRVKAVTIRRLSQRQAFVKLLRHTFNDILVDPARLRQQFAFSSEVSARAPVKALTYPRVKTALPLVQKVVLADVRRRSSGIRVLDRTA